MVGRAAKRTAGGTKGLGAAGAVGPSDRAAVATVGTAEVLRPALMGTKNLYENGPNPFFFVFFDLMGTRMVQIPIAKSV